MAKHLGVGIIGLGVGEAHLKAYLGCPHCHVVGICDFDQSKLEQVSQKYGRPKLVTTSADEIIGHPEIEVVSVASYDNYHFEHVDKALAQHKHVFVEKPLCLFEEEAQRLWERLKQNPDLRLSSNLILRKSPRFQRLRRMIRSGFFGQLYYLEGDYNYGRIEKILQGWRGKLDFYSPVYGGGIHMVDLLLWLASDEIVDVTAFANKVVTQHSNYRFPDLVCALCRFRGGAVAKICANFGCVYPHFHKLSLYGTEATFENSFEHGVVFTKRDAQIDLTRPSESGIFRIEEPHSPPDKGGLIREFVESVARGTPLEVGPADVFQTMAVCFAIQKAAMQGGTARVSSFVGDATVLTDSETSAKLA